MRNIPGRRYLNRTALIAALALASSAVLANPVQEGQAPGTSQGLPADGLPVSPRQMCDPGGHQARIHSVQGQALCCCTTSTGQTCCAQSLDCSYSPPGCLCRP